MIYIFVPDVPAEPIGGVQTLFDYAERLNELGRKAVATIVCPASYIRGILPRPYPLVPVLRTVPKLAASDTLIFPEVLVSTVDQYPSENKKYVAVLNYQYFEVYARQSQTFLSHITGFLTNSKFTAKQLQEKYPDYSVAHIPHVIEPRFCATTPFSKRDQYSVLILNRKNTKHIPTVLSFLEHVPHRVTLVNNISNDKLVSLYNQHQIFINLGYPEGFCRPAAEAMACGCVVVGFTGGGGGDFMKQGINSFIAADGNEEELLKQLSFVLHDMSKQELNDVSLQAREIIATMYTKAAQAKKLYSLFKKEIAKSYTAKNIDRLYRNTKVVAHKKAHRMAYEKVTKETLELQLFHERQKYQDITNSKFFELWQTYCAVRDVIKGYATQVLSQKKFSN